MVNRLVGRRGFLTAIGVSAIVGAVHPATATLSERNSTLANWSGYRGGPRQNGASVVKGIESVERTRWTAGGEDSQATMPAVVDGTAYLGVGSRVMSVDVNSGIAEWITSAPTSISVTPCVGSGLVIATTNGGDVLALDRETGEQQWSIGISGGVGAPSISDGVVYVGNSNGRILALEAQSGEVNWSVRRDDVNVSESSPTSSVSIGRPAPSVSGDALYVNLTTSSGGGKIVSLDRSTGEELWSQSFEHDYVYPPAVDGDLLAVVSGFGNLKLLSKTGGLVKWEKNLEHDIESPPAFDGNTVSLVMSPTFSDTRCSAFDANTGEKRWEYVFGGRVTAGGVGFARDMVYATADLDGGITVALDYESGLEQFTYNTGYPGHGTPTPVESGLVVPDGSRVSCLGNGTVGTTSSASSDEQRPSETEPSSSTGSTQPNSQDEASTVSDDGPDSSRSFFGGDSPLGANTLTVVSTIVTVIGTFVGLMQLLKGD